MAMCTVRVAITTESGAGGGRKVAAIAARVRDWRPGDATACAAIYAPWVAETTVSFELEPPDADEIARRFAALIAQGYPVLVAAAGFRRMVAVIADSANVGSIGFHRALGFEDGGVLPGVGLKFGRELDIVLMWRALAVDGNG